MEVWEWALIALFLFAWIGVPLLIFLYFCLVIALKGRSDSTPRTLEKDRIQAACSRGWSNPLTFRRAIRDCSAFGPRGEREPAP